VDAPRRPLPFTDEVEDPHEELLDRVFFALSDPVRRAILKRLGRGHLLVSEVAAPFDISLQAVSRHVQVLVQAGLVQQERTGRIARCRLEVGPMFAAATWINEYSQYWQAQFDALAGWLKTLKPQAVAAVDPHAANRPQAHEQEEGAMRYREASRKVAAYRKRIEALRRRMHGAQRRVTPAPVEDYTLSTTKGPVRLSQLFGGKRDLLVIHNMGSGCPACTMWADGYNGLYPHLADRAAFVVSSPDSPAVQQRFARSRGWRFPMVSHQGTTFAADMGYRTRSGDWLPGVSAFRRTRDGVVRLGDTGFHPGDDFCSAWHFFDLFPEGAAGWRPRFRYTSQGASR